MSDTANQQFPLNDIDYESNPAAVAQELSNLQALRRMSMDVGNTSDPDLPSFQGRPVMPSVAPTGGDDEDDPSRLFWVPARVHPELAPMEFKSFLETRVKTIKRRSGESTSLAPDMLERSGSASSLRRKKSMLSRQIDNSGGKGGLGYQDGADKLERRKSLLSQSHSGSEIKISDLTQLDELVKDPAKAFQKLSMERGMHDDAGAEVPADEDMPILPAAPGFGLRRSTHTTYRKGSLRRGERVPYSKRAGVRQVEADGDDPFTSPGIKRVMSEPVSENFSRPNRRRGPTIEDKDSEQVQGSKYELSDQQFGEETLSRTESHRSDASLPQIIETPPEDEQTSGEAQSPSYSFPERSSSFNQPQPAEQPPTEPPPRSSRRPGVARQVSSTADSIPKSSKANLVNELTQSPSPLPGSSTRTDSLTFIPTVIEEKKPEVKSHKDRERDKDDNESTTSSKKGWGWFKGGDDKNKKDKKKDDESKKSKAKVSLEKTHDGARLDVLQHSIESNAQRGRESLHQERESFESKLSDERKKESSRKSGKEEKKEKDGLFSSLFGGKKKGERDSGGKKSASLRALSPEPPRHLRPDVDYSWTRFSLLEERAIYRMAHIKLANPRRPLHSQVLLSNFMYAYLAKVQQMHPHVQVPQSAAQKKAQEAERKAKEAERRQEEEQQQGEQYRYDYHQVRSDALYTKDAVYACNTNHPQGIANYADSPSDQQQQHQHQQHQQQQHDASETVTYVDDSQIYDYDHQDDGHNGSGSGSQNQSRTASRRQGDDYSQSGQGQYSHQQQQQYYQYDNQQQGAYDHDKDGDMW